MDDQKKDHFNPKRSPQTNRPKQLQTHNVSIYDVENTCDTNKGRDVLQAKKTEDCFLKEQIGCRKESRGTGKLLYMDQYILNESKTRRKNLPIARIDNKKDIWYWPAKLDNKLLQKVQNIRWSNKLYRENHVKLVRGM